MHDGGCVWQMLRWLSAHRHASDMYGMMVCVSDTAVKVVHTMTRLTCMMVGVSDRWAVTADKLYSRVIQIAQCDPRRVEQFSTFWRRRASKHTAMEPQFSARTSKWHHPLSPISQCQVNKKTTKAGWRMFPFLTIDVMRLAPAYGFPTRKLEFMSGHTVTFDNFRKSVVVILNVYHVEKLLCGSVYLSFSSDHTTRDSGTFTFNFRKAVVVILDVYHFLKSAAWLSLSSFSSNRRTRGSIIHAFNFWTGVESTACLSKQAVGFPVSRLHKCLPFRKMTRQSLF